MDYWERPVVGVSPQAQAQALEQARQFSLSFFYWMQTDAPRRDHGYGYPGLRLRGDVLGTPDGLAKQAYYREGRRIQAEFTVLEQHLGVKARQGLGQGHDRAERFHDSVGIGAYRIDLHPSTRGRNTVDIDAFPFQIPLGALLPVRVDNLLPACKNLGTTRVTNGALREHATEWPAARWRPLPCKSNNRPGRCGPTLPCWPSFNARLKTRVCCWPGLNLAP